jgi:uncharacterized protein YbaP (TraB family)
MKNSRIFLILFVFVMFVFVSCKSHADSLGQDTAGPNIHRPDIHGLLSKIEYNGNTVYLFGSMHLGRKNWYPLNRAVEKAIAKADAFVFEYDLTSIGSAEYSAMATNYLALGGGMTLKDYLPPDVFDNFIQKLSTYDIITYDMISALTPMAVTTIITAIEIYPEIGLEEESGVDNYLLDYALKNGKPVYGLNPLARELSLLFDLPYEVQLAIIEDFQDKQTTLEVLEETALIEAYEAQNEQALLESLRYAFKDQDNPFVKYMVDIMIVQRSVDFAREIERLLRETREPATFFVTMGIGHLIGDDYGNVFNILRDKGYTITSMFN